MSVLPDWMIERDVVIEPKPSKIQTAKGVISHGYSSYGVDIRIGSKFKVFTPTYSTEIDPKNFNDKVFLDIDVSDKKPPDNFIRIPPNSYCLCESMEYFEIPRDVLAIVIGKSTYCRCGIICNLSPLEPEWKGKITIEISNAAPLPARIYANEGIAQVMFFRSDGYRERLWTGDAKNLTCDTSYGDRKGRYNNQVDITLPFVNKE